jgi:hypothetical protein
MQKEEGIDNQARKIRRAKEEISRGVDSGRV